MKLTNGARTNCYRFTFVLLLCYFFFFSPYHRPNKTLVIHTIAIFKTENTRRDIYVIFRLLYAKSDIVGGTHVAGGENAHHSTGSLSSISFTSIKYLNVFSTIMRRRLFFRARHAIFELHNIIRVVITVQPIRKTPGGRLIRLITTNRHYVSVRQRRSLIYPVRTRRPCAIVGTVK